MPGCGLCVRPPIGKSPLIVVLVFGVPSVMTRIEFKKKCNEVGWHCFAVGTVEREGEHFRATLTPKASTERQRINGRKSVGMG